jgi:hypothetical protein
MNLLRVYLFHTERGIQRGAVDSDAKPKSNEAVWWSPKLNYVLIQTIHPKDKKKTTSISSYPIVGEYSLRFFMNHSEYSSLKELGIDIEKPSEPEKKVVRKKVSKKVKKDVKEE